jgi:hypothetical protein
LANAGTVVLVLYSGSPIRKKMCGAWGGGTRFAARADTTETRVRHRTARKRLRVMGNKRRVDYVREVLFG